MINEMQVTFFQRKPRPWCNYSVENVFDDVRRRLPGVKSRLHIAPCISNGVLRRIVIMLDAALHQSEVNHVTGDITFASLFLLRGRTVVTILDCKDVDGNRGLSAWLYRKLWFEWPARHCAVVTTISHASKSDIVRITGCDPDKVVVTGVAISPNFKAVEKPFNAARPRILQVGTAPNKNIERLTVALKGLSCVLVIVGALSASQEAALRSNEIAYESHIGLSQEELIRQYEAADVVAFVSTFEGFGMPIVEANSVGRVVVTSDSASMPEVAGDAACIVDPFCTESIRAGLLRVISDNAYRQTLIINGFKNAARFDGDQIAQCYLRVYRQVASYRENEVSRRVNCVFERRFPE